MALAALRDQADSARRRVLSFPIIQDAVWIAADETSPGYADRLAPLPTAILLGVTPPTPQSMLADAHQGRCASLARARLLGCK